MASLAGSVAAASATTTASTRCRRRRVAASVGPDATRSRARRPRVVARARGFGVSEADDDATTDGDGDGEVGEVGANDDANDASSSSSSSIADAPSRAAASAAVRALADRVLPNGASVNDRDNETGETALVVASERGDLDDVRALLAVGADTSVRGAVSAQLRPRSPRFCKFSAVFVGGVYPLALFVGVLVFADCPGPRAGGRGLTGGRGRTTRPRSTWR